MKAARAIDTVATILAAPVDMWNSRMWSPEDSSPLVLSAVTLSFGSLVVITNVTHAHVKAGRFTYVYIYCRLVLCKLYL